MKKEKKMSSISTFLGFDSSIDGSIDFKGTLRMDGRAKGKISGTGGTLIVGEKAVIDADIMVDTIIIMGTVSGSINARERIEVHAPGRLSGDIQAAMISIEPGGIFNGNCTMKSKTVTLKKSIVSAQIPSVSGLPKSK